MGLAGEMLKILEGLVYHQKEGRLDSLPSFSDLGSNGK